MIKNDQKSDKNDQKRPKTSKKAQNEQKISIMLSYGRKQNIYERWSGSPQHFVQKYLKMPQVPSKNKCVTCTIMYATARARVWLIAVLCKVLAAPNIM